MKKVLLFLLPLVAACSRMPAGSPEGVYVAIRVDGQYTTRATVADVPELMETDISGGLDIFIAGHGVFVKYRINNPEDGGVYFLSSSWKETGILTGYSYDVYAIAGGEYDPGTIHSVEDLNNLTTGQDIDIYRIYDADAGTYDLAKTNSKKFVMDGFTTWLPTNALEQTIPLTLRRAAVKLNISFSLSDSMSGYELYGTPQWKFVGYSTSASLLAGGNNGCPATATTPSPMNVTSHSTDGGRIITYSYPFTWQEDENPATVLLNIPLKCADNSIIRNNWYSIPVVDITKDGPWSLNRNTYYDIEAVLECVGSSGESSGDTPVNLNYHILEWVYNSITDKVDINGQDVSYLLVDPTECEIREKVLIGSLQPRSLSLNFWSSGDIVIGPPQVYYYDKYDTRVDISSGADTYITSNGWKEGTIQVVSQALGNNTIKYIRFNVSLADSPSTNVDVLVRHYPLDYIQNIEGLWSSLVTDGGVNWDLDQTVHSTQRTVNNPIFQAKVWDNGGIYRIQERRSGSGYVAYVGSNISNLKNNRMYVVQITSTSDDYNVGRVHLNSLFQSQEHLVSPAFMIASQLGATQTTRDAEAAASQCGNYKEVTADGTAYTGWRLPTREEIGIIMGYQYSSDAIAEVLAGSHYWTLEGKAVSKTDYGNTSSDGTTGYIRCVRDLTVEDVQKINDKE